MFISLGVNAQVYKLENDTVQYFKLDKNFSISDNITYNLFNYTGYGYGRTDTLVLDFDNMKYISGSKRVCLITKVEKGIDEIMFLSISPIGVKYYSLYRLDKSTNRWFVLYINESTYEGGLYYPTVL